MVKNQQKFLFLTLVLVLLFGIAAATPSGRPVNAAEGQPIDTWRSSKDPEPANPLQESWLYLPILMRPPETQAIVIDHTTTDLSQIPPVYLEKAKEMLRLSYGHTSHGSQIVSGMAYLAQHYPDLQFNTDGAVVPDVLSLADYTPSGDLGNPDFYTWSDRTRTYLNGSGHDRNVVIWSWCGQVSGASETLMAESYLSLMPALEQDYPGIRFVYMTGHLDGTGVDGNLYQRNNQIREFVRRNDKILFDFADIESYDPDGNYYPEADDSCPWCQAYCDQHPGYCPDPPIDCAHSHSLNCYEKGKAFWWLLARLAGWNGVTKE